MLVCSAKREERDIHAFAGAETQLFHAPLGSGLLLIIMERDGRAAVGKGHNGLAGQPQQVEQGQQEKQSAEVARHLAQTADLIVACRCWLS